ncbi:MAG: hypothetical protein EOO62_00600 [Hymenobacter sp.]|nr:MAG: hypothetical protein EOO62_00600 [Hymenobacter sp.]
MEPDELQTLWQQAQPPLPSASLVSPPPPLASTQRPAAAALGALRPLKALALALGLGWVVLVDAVLLRVWPWASWFFLVSAGLQVLLTQVVLGIYLYQLLLLRQVNAGAPVVATQHRIARLQATTLGAIRVSVLQLPCWTTFYWNAHFPLHAPLGWLLLQAGLTLLATLAAVWLFRHLTYANRHQRWFQWVFNGPEWQPLTQALHLLEQIAAYQTAQVEWKAGEGEDNTTPNATFKPNF